MGLIKRHPTLLRNMQIGILVICIIIISNFAIYLNGGTRYNSNWNVEVVDSGEHSSDIGCPIGIATDGNPIIVYQSPYGKLIARKTANHNWQLDNIGGDYSDPFMRSSMVIDTIGNIHLVYLGGAAQLVYAKNPPGGNWERYNSEDGCYDSSSLAVDNNGNPHIVYYRFGLLNYTYWNNGDWTTITLENLSGILAEKEISKIELDTSNNPHIITHDVSNERMKYFHWNGANWSLEIIDCPSCLRCSPDLCIDSYGSPHIIFVDERNASLTHIEKSGNEWRAETIDTNVFNSFPAMAIDRNNVVYVAYYANALKFAKKVRDSWSTETIDSSERAGSSPSIAIDKTGNVHIAYVDRNTWNLNYATTKKSGPFRVYPISAMDYAVYIGVSVLILTISLVVSFVVFRRNKKIEVRKRQPPKRPASQKR
jgi:hypothetical protein